MHLSPCFSSKLQKPNQSSLDGVQVLLQVERPALDLPSKVVLHWSNWNGAPNAHQLLRIKKWAVEIKESFFSSLPWCGDGPCAEFPAEITGASKAAAPAKGCARLWWEPKHTCRLTCVLLELCVVFLCSRNFLFFFFHLKMLCFAVSVLERLKKFVTKMLGRFLAHRGDTVWSQFGGMHKLILFLCDESW